MAVLLLGLVGCGPAPSAEADQLIGQVYWSEEVTSDGEPVELVGDSRIELSFIEGKLAAYAGCNYFSFDLSVTRTRLVTANFATTLMGCDPPREAQDDWLAEYLMSSPAWTLADHRLTLASGQTRIVLRDRRFVEPHRPLAGPQWVVDTFVRGGTGSALPEGTEGRAWLVLDEATYRANSGCREYHGRVSAESGQIRFFETARSELDCPPTLAVLDIVMSTLLAGEAEFWIDADRLYLMNEDGIGLELFAER